jgi:hypothetical protein
MIFHIKYFILFHLSCYETSQITLMLYKKIFRNVKNLKIGKNSPHIAFFLNKQKKSRKNNLAWNFFNNSKQNCDLEFVSIWELNAARGAKLAESANWNALLQAVFHSAPNWFESVRETFHKLSFSLALSLQILISLTLPLALFIFCVLYIFNSICTRN